MFSWFYLGTVSQTITNSLHYRKTVAQTDSLNLIKIINLTLNFNQPELIETIKNNNNNNNNKKQTNKKTKKTQKCTLFCPVSNTRLRLGLI